MEGALSFPTSCFPTCFFLTSAEPQLALRVPCFRCRLQPAGAEAPDNSRGVSDSQVTHTFSAGLGAEETWVESGMIQHMKGACRCSDTNSLSVGVAELVFFITLSEHVSCSDKWLKLGIVQVLRKEKFCERFRRVCLKR